MIAIHTDAPMIPLAQMVQGDGLIEIGGELTHVVVVEDALVAYWIAQTLGILGHRVLVPEDGSAVA